MSSRKKEKARKGDKYRPTGDLVEIAPQQIVEPATTTVESSRGFDAPRQQTLTRGESDDYYNSHPQNVAVTGGGPPGAGGGYTQSPVDIRPVYGGGAGGPLITSAGGEDGEEGGHGGGHGTAPPPPQSYYPTIGAGGGYGGYGAPTGYHPNTSHTHSAPPPHNGYTAYNAPPLQHNASYVAHVYQAPPPHSQNTFPHPSHHGPPPQQSYGGYTHPQQYNGKPPRRDSTSSSSSGSYVEISRYATLPALKQNPLAAMKTFFTAPSGSKRRAIKKRPSASSLGRKNPKKKHGRRHSSSSSEVDSDLAYGTAFIKRHRLRRRGSRGSRSPRGRRYGSPRREGSRSPRRASPWKYTDTGYQPSAHPSHASQIMPGAFSADHRELSDQERDQQPQPSLSSRESGKAEKKKKKSADDEIRKIGEDLGKLAKQQNKLHLAKATKHSTLNPRRDDPRRHGLGPKEVERGLGNSKPFEHDHGKHGKYGHGDDDSDAWEDDSSSESDSSSANSALAFGGEDAYPRFRRTPPPRAQGGPRRKPTIVDPRLFGPNNSLAGAVTTPVGFGEVDIMGPGGSTPIPPPNVKQTGYFRSPLPSPKPAARSERDVEESRRRAKERAVMEMQRRNSGRDSGRDSGKDGRNGELRQVFPIPTSDPHAFDALTSTPKLSQGSMEKRPSFHARTDSLPLRQPKPMSPVRQQVYDGQVSSPELLRSHDHALGGLAGAALAAAIAEEKRARREALHHDEEERRRDEVKEIDSMRMFRDDMARRNGKSPELVKSRPATITGHSTPMFSAVGDRHGRESRVDPFQYQASDLGDDVFEKKIYAPKPLHERIAARAAESNPDTSRRGSRGGTPTGSRKGKEPTAEYITSKSDKYPPDSLREKNDDPILSNIAGVAAAAIGGVGIAKMASRAAERGPDTYFRRPADFSTKPEIYRSQTFPTTGSEGARGQRAAFLDDEGPTEPLISGGLGSSVDIGNSIERGYTPAIVSVERKPKWARDVSPMPSTRSAYSPPLAQGRAVSRAGEGNPPPQIADAAPSFARFEGGTPSSLPHEREPSFVSYDDPQPFSEAVENAEVGIRNETKPGDRREALRRFNSDADHRYAAMSSDYFSSREPARGRSRTRSPSSEIRPDRDAGLLRSRSCSQSRKRSKSPNVRQARRSDREARKTSYREGNDEDWRLDEGDHESRTRDLDRERGRALDEEEKIYDEVEHFTAPLPTVAISSAVHAIHAQDVRRSRDQSPVSHRSQDSVQDDADRIYKETVLASRIAKSHIRENSPPRVATPPAMEHREREKQREQHNNKKGLYSEPDADFVFDHEMHPHEEKIFSPVVLRKSWPILAEMELESPFDPSLLGLNRPLLNIVRPTPDPEKQIKLQMPRSRSQSRERRSEPTKEVEDKADYGAPVVVADVPDICTPLRSTEDPQPLERKVSWGENETQHYDIVTPYPDDPSHNPFTTTSTTSPPSQSPTDGKRTPPWEHSHPAGKALPSIPPPSDDEDHTHNPPAQPDLETLRELALTRSSSPKPPTRPKPKSIWSRFTPDLAAKIKEQEAAAALLVNASTIGFADGDEGEDVNSLDKAPSRLEELRERERIWAREEDEREEHEAELERKAQKAERQAFKKGKVFEYRGIIVEPENSPENSTSTSAERGRGIELGRHDSGSPPPVGPKPSVMPGGFDDDTAMPVFAYRAVSPSGSDVDTVIYHQASDLSTKAKLDTSPADNSRPASRDAPKIGSDDSFVVVEAEPTPPEDRNETMVVVVEPEDGKSESFAVVDHPEQREEMQSLLENAAPEDGSPMETDSFVTPLETPGGDIVTPFETDGGIDGIGASAELQMEESGVIVDPLVDETREFPREESVVIVDAPVKEDMEDKPKVEIGDLNPAEDIEDATREIAEPQEQTLQQEVIPEIVDNEPSLESQAEAAREFVEDKDSANAVSTPVIEAAADPSETSSSGKKLNKKQRKALEKKQAAEVAQATLEATAISVAAGAGVALIVDALKDEPKSDETTREVTEAVADEIRDAPLENLKDVVDANLEETPAIVDALTMENPKPGVEAQDKTFREVLDTPIEQPLTSVVTDALNEQKSDEATGEAVRAPAIISSSENDSQRMEAVPAKKLNKKQRKALEKAQAAEKAIREQEERDAELAGSTPAVDGAESGRELAVDELETSKVETMDGKVDERIEQVTDAPIGIAEPHTDNEPTEIVVKNTEPHPEEGFESLEEAVQPMHDATAETVTSTEPAITGPTDAEQAIINEQATAEPIMGGPTAEEQAAINEQVTAEPISEVVNSPIETASKEVDITDVPTSTPQDSSAEATVSEEPPKGLNKKQRKAWLKAKKADDEAAALEAANAPVEVPADTPVKEVAMEVLPAGAVVGVSGQESREVVEPHTDNEPTEIVIKNTEPQPKEGLKSLEEAVQLMHDATAEAVTSTEPAITGPTDAEQATINEQATAEPISEVVNSPIEISSKEVDITDVPTSTPQDSSAEATVSEEPPKGLNKKQRKAWLKAKKADDEAAALEAANAPVEVPADTPVKEVAMEVLPAGAVVGVSGQESREVVEPQTDNEPTEMVIKNNEPQQEEGFKSLEEAVQPMHDATAETVTSTEPAITGPTDAEQAIINEQATAEPIMEGPTAQEQAAINEQVTAEPISEVVNSPIETASKEVDITDAPTSTPQDSSAEATVSEEPPKGLNKKQRKAWLKAKKADDEAAALEAANAPVEVPADTPVKEVAMEVLPAGAVVGVSDQESREVVEPQTDNEPTEIVIKNTEPQPEEGFKSLEEAVQPMHDATAETVTSAEPVISEPTDAEQAIINEQATAEPIMEGPTSEEQAAINEQVTAEPISEVVNSPIETASKEVDITDVPTSTPQESSAEATVSEEPPKGLNKKQRKAWLKAKKADDEAAALEAANAPVEVPAEAPAKEVAMEVLPAGAVVGVSSPESREVVEPPVETPAVQVLSGGEIVDIPGEQSCEVDEAAIELSVETPVVEVLPGGEIVDIPSEEVRHDIQSTEDLTSDSVGTNEPSTTINILPESSPIVTTADALAATGYTIRESEPTPFSPGDVLVAEASPTADQLQAILDAGPPEGLNKKKRKEWEKATKAKIADAEAAALAVAEAQYNLDAEEDHPMESNLEQERELSVEDVMPEVLPTPIYEDESGAFASAPPQTPPIEGGLKEGERKPKSRVISLSMAEAAALAEVGDDADAPPPLTRKLSKKDKKKLEQEAKKRKLAGLDEAAGDDNGSSTPTDTDGDARISVPVDAFADLASARDAIEDEFAEPCILNKRKKNKGKGKAVELSDDDLSSEPVAEASSEALNEASANATLETGTEESKEFRTIIPIEENGEIIEQTDDDDAFHSANEAGPNDQATDDGNLTETEFTTPRKLPSDANDYSNGHTEPEVIEQSVEDAKETEAAQEEGFESVSSKKKKKKKKKCGTGTGTASGSGDVSETTANEETAAEQASEKESFLARADIPGAGVGLAGAVAANALVSLDENAHQQSNADGAERWSQPLIESVQEATDAHKALGAVERHEDEDGNKTVMGLEDIQERNELVAGLSKERWMATDPDIKQREIRPSIDPQFGDLLPLPPSTPGSPHPELGEEGSAIRLPESPPPACPETGRDLQLSGSPQTPGKRASGSHIPRSPSVSAVPLNFLLRSRGSGSMPSSPITWQVGATSPTRTDANGQSVGSKERKRPTSWDSSKEMQPFQLPEFVRGHSRSNSFVRLAPLPERGAVEEQAVETSEPKKEIVQQPMGPPTLEESQPIEPVGTETPLHVCVNETATESSAVESAASKKSKKKKKKGKQAGVLETEPVFETALPTETVSETPVGITTDVVQESVGDTPVETTRNAIEDAAVITVTQDAIDEAPNEVPVEHTEPVTQASGQAAADGNGEVRSATVEAVVAKKLLQQSTAETLQMPVEPVINTAHEDPTEKCSADSVVVGDATADIPNSDRPLQTPAEDLSTTDLSTATCSKSKKKKKKGKQAVVREPEPIVENPFLTERIAETPIVAAADVVQEPVGGGPVETTREIVEAPIASETTQRTIAEAFIEVPTKIAEAVGDTTELVHDNIVVDPFKVEVVPADTSILETKIEEPQQAPIESVQYLTQGSPSEQASAVAAASQKAAAEIPMIETPLVEPATDDPSSTGFSTATSSKSKKKKKKGNKESSTGAIPEPGTVAEGSPGSLKGSTSATVVAMAMDGKPEYFPPPTDENIQDLEPIIETVIATVEAPVDALSQSLHEATKEVLDAPINIREPPFDPSISPPTEQEQAMINAQATSKPSPEESDTPLAEPFIGDLEARSADALTKMPGRDTAADMAEAPIIEPLIKEVNTTEAPVDTPALAVESQAPTSSDVTESEEPPKGLNKKQRKAWLKAKNAAAEFKTSDAVNTPAEVPGESPAEPPAEAITEAQVVENVTAFEPLPVVEEAVQDEAAIESSPGLTTAEAVRSAGYFIAPNSARVHDTSIVDEPATEVPLLSASDMALADIENVTQTVDQLRSILDTGSPAGLNKKKRKEWEKVQKAKLAEAEAVAAQVIQSAAEAEIETSEEPERGSSVEQEAYEVLSKETPVQRTDDATVEPVTSSETVVEPRTMQDDATSNALPVASLEPNFESVAIGQLVADEAAKDIALPEMPREAPADITVEKVPSTSSTSVSSKVKKKKKAKVTSVEPKPEPLVDGHIQGAGDDNQSQGEAVKDLEVAPLHDPTQPSEVVLQNSVVVELSNEAIVDAPIETPAEITEPVPEPAQVMAESTSEPSLDEAAKDVSTETTKSTSEIIAPIETPQAVANEIVAFIAPPNIEEAPAQSPRGLTTAEALARAGFAISAKPIAMSKDKGKELVEATTKTDLSETLIETPGETAAEGERALVKKLNKRERRALEKKLARETELTAAATATAAETSRAACGKLTEPIVADDSINDKSVPEQSLEPPLPLTNAALAQIEHVFPEIPLLISDSDFVAPLETPADTVVESNWAPNRKPSKKEKQALEEKQTVELGAPAKSSNAPVEVVEPILEQPSHVSERAIERPTLENTQEIEKLPMLVEQPVEEISNEARSSESAPKAPVETTSEKAASSVRELQSILDAGPPPGLSMKKCKEWEKNQKAKLAEAEAPLLASRSTGVDNPIEKDVVIRPATFIESRVVEVKLEAAEGLPKDVSLEALLQDLQIEVANEVAIETPLPETPLEASLEELGIPNAASETPIESTADDHESSTPAKKLNKKQRRALEKQREKEAVEAKLAAAAPLWIVQEAPAEFAKALPAIEREAEIEPPQDVATEALPEVPAETPTKSPPPATPLEMPANTSTVTVSESLQDPIGVSRKKSKRKKKGNKDAVTEPEPGPKLDIVVKESARDALIEETLPENSAGKKKTTLPEIILEHSTRPEPVTFDNFRTHLDAEELGRAIASAIPLPSEGATPYETDVNLATQTTEPISPPLPSTFESARTHLSDEKLCRALGTDVPLPSIGATPCETDNDFAATIAAGLEASGFDAGKVMGDPNFSRHVSPIQSAVQLTSETLPDNRAPSRPLSPRASQDQLARDIERPESPLNEDEGVYKPLFSKKTKKKGKGKSAGFELNLERGVDGMEGTETVEPSEVPTSEYDRADEPGSPTAIKKKKAKKSKAGSGSIAERMPSTTSVVKEPSIPVKDTAVVAGVVVLTSGILPDSSESGGRNKAKKGKRGKVVDMRSGGDDLFDDPALWEGADPKSFEEAPHGNKGADEAQGGGEDFIGDGPVDKEETGHEHGGNFASTIAAGLEASGFDAGKVLQDPTFSPSGSPKPESKAVKDSIMARAILDTDNCLSEPTLYMDDTTARPALQKEDAYVNRDIQEGASDAALLHQPISASAAEILKPETGVLAPPKEVRRKVSDLVKKFEVRKENDKALPVGQEHKDKNLTRQGPDVDQEDERGESTDTKGVERSPPPETLEEPVVLPVKDSFKNNGSALTPLDLERSAGPAKRDSIDDVKEFFEQEKLKKKDQKALDRRNALVADKEKASDEAMRRRYQELEEEVVQSRGGTPVQELHRSEVPSRTDSSGEGPSVEISAAPIESVDVDIVDRMSMESGERPVLTQKFSRKEQKKSDKQKRQKELEGGNEGEEILAAHDIVTRESEAQEVVQAPELRRQLEEPQSSMSPSITRKLSKEQQKASDKQRRLELASSTLSADGLQKNIGQDKNKDTSKQLTTTKTEQELPTQEATSSIPSSKESKKAKATAAQPDNGPIQQWLGTKSTSQQLPNRPLGPLLSSQGVHGETQQPRRSDQAQQQSSSPQEKGPAEAFVEGDREVQLSSLRRREDTLLPRKESPLFDADGAVQKEGLEGSPQGTRARESKKVELVGPSAHSGEGEAQVSNPSETPQAGPENTLGARAKSEADPAGDAARSLGGPSTLVDPSSTPKKLAMGTWSFDFQEKPENDDYMELEHTPTRLPAVPEEDSPRSDKGRSPTTPLKSWAPRGLAQADSGYTPEEQQPRSLANEKRYIRDSGTQSSGESHKQIFAADVLARRSWPPMNENEQTVDLGKKKRKEQKESLYAQITPINIAKAAAGLGLGGASLSNNSTPLSASPLFRKSSLEDRQLLNTPRHFSEAHRSVSERITTGPPDLFDRRGTPDSVISVKSRPVSVLSNRSYISSRTPPLRRSDRRVSGDLRSLSQLDLSARTDTESGTKVSAAPASAHDSIDSSDHSTTRNIKRHSTGSSSTRDNIYAQPTANESRPRLKSEEMAQAEIYDGFGEGHIGSPRSPTRPHSMRRQKSIQSMQISELQRQLEAAKAEIQRLSGGHGVDTNADLEDRIQELSQENIILSGAKAELETKVEENEELKATNHRLRQQRDELKKREQAIRDNYVELQNTHTETQAELEAAQAKSAEFDAGLADSLQAKVLQGTQHKDEEIEELRAEIQLKDNELARRDALIREKDREIVQLQAQIEAMKQAMLDDDFLDVMDDKHIVNACRRLYRDLYKFVGEYWKKSRGRPYHLTKDLRTPKVVNHIKRWGIDAEELLGRLDNCLLDDENIDQHLGDGGRRPNIYMTLLSTILYDRVFSRYFFALSQSEESHIMKVEKTVAEVGPPAALNDWRAKTLTFQSRNEKWQVARADEMRNVTEECLYTLRSLTDPPQTFADNGVTRYVLDELWAQLFSCVKEAVNLAVSLRTQKAKYTVGPILDKKIDAKGRLVKYRFHAEVMREVSGNTVDEDSLEQGVARLQAVLFPVVKRIGDDKGEGEEEVVVFKSRVLVQKEGKHAWVLKDGLGEGSVKGGRESRMSRRSLGTRGDSSMLDA